MARKIFLLIFGFLLPCLVVVREFWILPRASELYLSKEIFIARLPGAPLLMAGTNDWFLPLIAARFESWFWGQRQQNVLELEIEKGIIWENVSLMRIQEGLFLLKSDEARFLLFLAPVDRSTAFDIPIDYTVDFWVVWNSEFIEGFPPPKRGVLYLTGRKPTKSWHQWASEYNIPLVSTDATNSFRMLHQEDWKVFLN